jgi:hypothetical protein
VSTRDPLNCRHESVTELDLDRWTAKLCDSTLQRSAGPVACFTDAWCRCDDCGDHLCGVCRPAESTVEHVQRVLARIGEAIRRAKKNQVSA